MKKIALSILVLLLIGVFVWNRSKKTEGCDESQYFSDYTKKCEIAQVQMGLGSELEFRSISDLKKTFEVKTLRTVENPAYKEKQAKTRTYQGFDLEEVLLSLLPNGDSLADYVLVITCLDGFDPVIDHQILKKLETHKALLAFEQSGEIENTSRDGKWEVLSLKWGSVSPGPFYIVWETPEGTYWKGWPFQIRSMRLVKSDIYLSEIAKIKPSESELGKDPMSDVEVGFNQFKGKCLTCHSISGVGGKKARIDLVQLFKNMVERDQSLRVLNKAISRPPLGMADIKDIQFKDGDIEKINEYLWHMSHKN